MMASTVFRLGKPVYGFWNPGKAGDRETEPEDIIEMKDREIARLNRQLKALEGEIQKTREQAYTLGFEDGLVAEREKHNQA